MRDKEKKALLREIKKLLKTTNSYQDGTVESKMYYILRLLADKWDEIIKEDETDRPDEDSLDEWFFGEGGYVSMFYPYEAFQSEQYVRQDKQEPVVGHLFWSQLTYEQKLKFYKDNNKQG